MRYTEIRVGLKRVVNLGNYESAAFEIGLTASLGDEGDQIGTGLDPIVDAARFDEAVHQAQDDAARLLAAERTKRLNGRANGVTVEHKHAGQAIPS